MKGKNDARGVRIYGNMWEDRHKATAMKSWLHKIDAQALRQKSAYKKKVVAMKPWLHKIDAQALG